MSAADIRRCWVESCESKVIGARGLKMARKKKRRVQVF